jgi:hypothetical protein
MPNAAQLSASQRPRTVQCSATSKRTGKRCGQFVEEGHVVCRWHGGAAPRVAQAAEVRVLTARAASRLEAAPDVGDRNPFEVLIETMRDADRVLQALKLDVEADGGTLSPAMVDAIGQAIDRVARVAKLCIDANAEERLVAASERNGHFWAQAIQMILERLRLSPEQWSRTDDVVKSSLREMVTREELSRPAIEPGRSW